MPLLNGIPLLHSECYVRLKMGVWDLLGGLVEHVSLDLGVVGSSATMHGLRKIT